MRARARSTPAPCGPARAVGIGLDRDHFEAALQQPRRKDAGAGPELGHAPTGSQPEAVHDRIDERRGILRTEACIGRGARREALDRIAHRGIIARCRRADAVIV